MRALNPIQGPNVKVLVQGQRPRRKRRFGWRLKIRRSGEVPGGLGKNQKEPGGAARRSQEEPGGARRSQEEPGGARRSQEEPGRARRSQDNIDAPGSRKRSRGGTGVKHSQGLTSFLKARS